MESEQEVNLDLDGVLLESGAADLRMSRGEDLFFAWRLRDGLVCAEYLGEDHVVNVYGDRDGLHEKRVELEGLGFSDI
jgi:hypothetical protein